jgi:hypothetical protein
MALEPVDAREEPPGDASRPRPHREHHRVGFQRLAVHRHAMGRALALRHALDEPDAERGTAGLRPSDEGRGEARGVDLGGGLRRTERGGDDAGTVEPGGRRHAVAAAHGAPLARRQHEGVHAAVAVVAAELARQLRVEREARAGEGAQRRAVAPVEREEAAGLARGRARYARALDESDGDAPEGEEVGHGGADHAGAADDHVSRRRDGRRSETRMGRSANPRAVTTAGGLSRMADA